MNQIARGGYSLTPPEGGTTGVPLASSLRDQTPPSSSTLEGSNRGHRCAQTPPGGDRLSGPTGTYVRGVDPQKGLANQC